MPNPKGNVKNLKPIQPGECRNPHGRKGKDGTGGMSLKGELKAHLNRLTQAQRENFFNGLIAKCIEGDVNAIKLATLMNDEPLEAVRVDAEADNGVRISISMPAKDTDGTDI